MNGRKGFPTVAPVEFNLSKARVHEKGEVDKAFCECSDIDEGFYTTPGRPALTPWHLIDVEATTWAAAPV